CLAVVSVGAVRANGIKVTKKNQGSAAGTDAFNSPQLLDQAVQKALNSKRATLEKYIKEYLGKGDLIARGITLYSLNVRIGQPTIRWTSAREFEVMLKGNYLYARSTT